MATSTAKKPVEQPTQVSEDTTTVVEAVQTEVNENSKTISWRDLSLEVPPEIPPVLLFDFAAMESDGDSMSIMRVLHTLLGGEQFTQVRNIVGRESAEKQLEAIGDLAAVVMNAYGTNVGN